jgi:hypothetical protein
MLGKGINKTKGNKNGNINPSMSDTENNQGQISEFKTDTNENSTAKQSDQNDMPHNIEISQDPKQHPGKPSNLKQTNSNRSAFVMFMVTIAFFLSFAPAFPLIFIKSSIESNLERTLYKFFIRSYLLNCVVNPIIYGFFDPQFRRLCKMFFSCRQV